MASNILMNKQNIISLSRSLLKAKIVIETYWIKHQCLSPLVTQNFQRVLLGSQEDNVALWGKDAA